MFHGDFHASCGINYNNASLLRSPTGQTLHFISAVSEQQCLFQHICHHLGVCSVTSGAPASLCKQTQLAHKRAPPGRSQRPSLGPGCSFHPCSGSGGASRGSTRYRARGGRTRTQGWSSWVCRALVCRSSRGNDASSLCCKLLLFFCPVYQIKTFFTRSSPFCVHLQ